MKWKWVTGLILSAGMVLSLAVPVHAAGNPAKAAVDDATETAKKWKPDAILTRISSTTVDVDGKSSIWFYLFYSPKAGGYLNVTAKGRAMETLELGVGEKTALPAEYLDSPAIMAEANKAGLQGDARRMNLDRTAWIVSGSNIAVFLNPKTGKLVKRQKVQ